MTLEASQAKQLEKLPSLGQAASTLVSGLPFLIGIGLKNALTWPSQTAAAFNGVKLVRKTLSSTTACTDGTAAEANERASWRIRPRIFSSSSLSFSFVSGKSNWPLPFLAMH